MGDFPTGTEFRRLVFTDGSFINGSFTLEHIGNIYGHHPDAATKLCFYNAAAETVIPYEIVAVAHLAIQSETK